MTRLITLSRLKSVLVLLLLLALAAGAYYAWRLHPGPDDARYRVARLERGDIRQAVSANGTLNPVVLVNVGTQVSGTLQHLYADYNDRVRAGQVLARLDPALIKAQLGQSQASLASAQAAQKLAEANVRRARALFAKDYIARAELDQAIQSVEAGRAQVAAAAAQVQRDRTNLGYTVITSPVSGVVVSRNVDVGQTVAASFQTPTLFTIAQDLKRMQIDTTVAEADVGGIRVGQVARFTVDAFREREFRGTVRQIRLNSQILQNVVTYNVVIDVDNPEEILLPGMTAFVSIVLAERRDVLRLPVAALRFRPADGAKRPRPEGSTVYRLEDGRAVPLEVSTGIADGRFAEVVAGDLREGDPLIVGDLKALKTQEAPAGGGFRVRMF
jgi:HlyD family secretion protein